MKNLVTPSRHIISILHNYHLFLQCHWFTGISYSYAAGLSFREINAGSKDGNNLKDLTLIHTACEHSTSCSSLARSHVKREMTGKKTLKRLSPVLSGCGDFDGSGRRDNDFVTG